MSTLSYELDGVRTRSSTQINLSAMAYQNGLPGHNCITSDLSL